MIDNDIKLWIQQNAEAKTAAFAASLIPGLRLKMYGVRLPKLKAKARELKCLPDEIGEASCEELLLKGYVIGFIKDVGEQVRLLRDFVVKIDNWMVCDSFCSALNSAKKYQDIFWPLVMEYAQSKQDYEQRFAYVMMLKYFCNPRYIDRVLAVLTTANPKIWDTKQGVAWALAECFIKFPDKTEVVWQKITPEIYRLTRRKILDSKRVDTNIKQRLKNENRAHPDG